MKDNEEPRIFFLVDISSPAFEKKVKSSIVAQNLVSSGSEVQGLFISISQIEGYMLVFVFSFHDKYDKEKQNGEERV